MTVIFYAAVLGLCINLGNSLGSQRSQSPSEERYNYFDAELFQALNQKQGSNLLVSPISVKLVLGMLMEGAEGKTADEIRSALRLSEDKEAARKEFDTWLSVLQVKGSQNLKIADHVFLSNRYSINPVYNKTLVKHYAGGVTQVKFENAKEASKTINNWVSNATSKLIPRIVEENQMTSDPKMMITSAIYFKGLWSTPFAKERTTTRCFYPTDNKCDKTVMMMVTGFFDFGYISQLDATAVLLPYEGDAFSMLLLLPGKKGGVQQLSRDLLHVSINAIRSEMNHQEVFVQLPKFEISYSEDLVKTLKTLQISEVFTTNANLTNVLKPNSGSTSVSRVLHSAKITVDEEGTEGAGATGALFVPLMGGTTTSFIANRPFIFFLVDSLKNSIVFAGKVQSPKPPAGSTSKPIAPAAPSPKTSSSLVDIVMSEGPKFRSMRPSLNSTLNSTTSITSMRKSLDSRTLDHQTFFEQFISNENKIKKRAKTTPQSKNYKRQEDERRRHVLIFS